mgnify:CR=1 FL=1
MKRITIIYLVIISFFTVNSAHASNFDYGSIAGGYVEDGFTLEASMGGPGTENGVYARALGLFFDMEEGSVSGNADFLFANLGYHWSLSDTADILLEAGYVGAEATVCYTYCISEDESGYNIMAGFRSGNPDGVEFKLLVGRGDLVEADTIGQLEISFNFSETFSIYGGSFYDGEDSLTMAGFRYTFK